MRLPRDLSGRELARALGKAFGYQITRETGSHLRLTTQSGVQHHLTIPDHRSLRVGTLASILGEVAGHFQLQRDQVIERLFES
jgi:predicted RNA binding protein YcfA (HicA-like mRNA interferase family)